MHSKTHRILTGLLILIPLLLVIGCSDRLSEPKSETRLLLGTACTITLYDTAPDGAFDEAFARVEEIEWKMSSSRPESEVSAVNAASGSHPVEVSDDTFEVVAQAVAYSRLSDGRFDLTIGPVVSSWAISSDNPRVPREAELDEKLALVSYADVELDRERKSVFLPHTGQAIDLGAIAKGYAADEAAEILRDRGVEHAIIDFGGNILVMGGRLDGSPWRIGIQDPEANRGGYLGIVEARDATIVTSGVYERTFEYEGVSYHHILDPETGYPVENGLTSVSILADSSIDADALSTSVFALGYDRGLELVESLPGVEAVFIFEDRTIRLSPGLRDSFRLIDERYRVE